MSKVEQKKKKKTISLHIYEKLNRPKCTKHQYAKMLANKCKPTNGSGERERETK